MYEGEECDECLAMSLSCVTCGYCPEHCLCMEDDDYENEAQGF